MHHLDDRILRLLSAAPRSSVQLAAHLPATPLCCLLRRLQALRSEGRVSFAGVWSAAGQGTDRN